MNEDIIVDLIKQYGQERAIQIALNAGVPVTAIQYALSTPIGQAAQGDFYNMMGDVGSGIKKGTFNLSDMLFGTNFITPIGTGPRLPRVDQPNEQAMQMLTPQEQVQQTQQQIINEINQANQNNQNNQGGGGGSFVSGPAGMSGPSTPIGPNLVNRAQGGIVTLYGRY